MSLRDFKPLSAFALFAAACASQRSPAPTEARRTANTAPSTSTSTSTSTSATAAAAVPSANKPADGAEPCGALGCLAFATPAAALAHVLETHPRVLAVGEAHVQRGAEQIPSTARRFAELLPELERHGVSDIVIELLVPSPGCAQHEQRVAETATPITEPQAASNQNEFLALGRAAKAHGIEPHALTLTCEAAARIASANEKDGGTVERLLEAVASASESALQKLVAERPAPALLLAYGGALHNDLVPRAGRERWSFGPALKQATGGAYVELDLIVPEYVRDSDSWRAFAWYAAFAAAPESARTRLFAPNPGSFVLIFPNTRQTTPP